MRRNRILVTIAKHLPDTPENEPIYFYAGRAQGRFWLDDAEHPTALVAATEGRMPVCYLRQLDPAANVDWMKILDELKPTGALAGEQKLIRTLAVRLGYDIPSVEVVAAQKGLIVPKQELARPFSKWDPDAFRIVRKNAAWLWDAYVDPADALADFPAFGLVYEKAIVAVAMVISRSYKWANVGYWVHEPFRNQGYATRCGAALAAFLNQRGIKVTATTDETHLASLEVMRKLGLLEVCRYGLAQQIG